VPIRTVDSFSNLSSMSPSTCDVQVNSNKFSISATGSTLIQSTLSSAQQQESTNRGLDCSTIQSTRLPNSFPSSFEKRSETEQEKKIPTDFQLRTLDGLVPLVVPRTLAPFDAKATTTGFAHGTPSSGSGTWISYFIPNSRGENNYFLKIKVPMVL
jgi:hypothetical protein